jgi:segregation and condensation protein B
MATLDKEQQNQLRGVLAALLLAADGPLKSELLVDLLNLAADDEEWPFRVHPKILEDTLYAMQLDYDAQRGIELVSVSGGWRFRTSPNYSEMVRRLWPERKVRLSKAALEALAVVAYRQPCTRLDVESVRGVDCGGVVRSLLERWVFALNACRPGSWRMYDRTAQTSSVRTYFSRRTLPRRLSTRRHSNSAHL